MEEIESTKSLLQQCICCSKKPSVKDKKKEKLKHELIDMAPVNSELVTHNGVTYFPEQLMPQDMLDDQGSILDSMSQIPGSVPPFILKTKKLNLKLKFKSS